MLTQPLFQGQLPVYPPGPHCNPKGLTPLGEHLIRSMMKKGMIVETDHMSMKARRQTLSILEGSKYPGVISSHSWGDPGSQKRLQKLGGIVGPISSVATSFADEWRVARANRDTRFFFGTPFGSDINGLHAQPVPRPNAAQNPVKYPFRSFDGGSVIDQPALGHARVRHQHRRRRPLRPLSGLDRGPAQGRAASRSWTTWPTAPRPTCSCGRARRPRRAERSNEYVSSRMRRLTSAALAAALLVALAAPAQAANRWIQKKAPFNIAHQGGEDEFPSNTIYAFRKAVRTGADMLELDIGVTKDNKVIVMHDTTVDGKTNGHGTVASKTLAQIKRLDAAYWFAPRATRTTATTSHARAYRSAAWPRGAGSRRRASEPRTSACPPCAR